MKMAPEKENAISKRTFRSALIELFEREYKLVGSHKVIELIADDICQLRDEFYPRSGEEVYGNLTRHSRNQNLAVIFSFHFAKMFGLKGLSWVTTASENKKPKLGQRVEDYKSVRVSLPLVNESDLKMLETMQAPSGTN